MIEEITEMNDATSASWPVREDLQTRIMRDGGATFEALKREDDEDLRRIQREQLDQAHARAAVLSNETRVSVRQKLAAVAAAVAEYSAAVNAHNLEVAQIAWYLEQRLSEGSISKQTALNQPGYSANWKAGAGDLAGHHSAQFSMGSGGSGGGQIRGLQELESAVQTALRQVPFGGVPFGKDCWSVPKENGVSANIRIHFAGANPFPLFRRMREESAEVLAANKFKIRS